MVGAVFKGFHNKQFKKQHDPYHTVKIFNSAGLCLWTPASKTMCKSVKNGKEHGEEI